MRSQEDSLYREGRDVVNNPPHICERIKGGERDVEMMGKGT